jgi:hypothetical protein
MKKLAVSVLGVAVALGLGAVMLVPTTAAAKPVKWTVRMIGFGLIYPNGRYEYDFGAVVGAHGDRRCKGAAR